MAATWTLFGPFFGQKEGKYLAISRALAEPPSPILETSVLTRGIMPQAVNVYCHDDIFAGSYAPSPVAQ